MPENIVSPTPQVPTPEPISTDPVVTIPPARKKSPILLFIALVLLSLVSVLATYLFLQVRTLTLEQIAPSPSPTPVASVDPTSDWSTFRNDEIGFSIQYPLGWRVVETFRSVGFGPQEIGEDTIVGVTYYSKDDYEPSDITAEIGSQFKDRVVKSDFVIVDKTKVGKVIVTTPTLPDWYSESIIFETNKYYIVVNNGAVKNENLPFNRGVPADFTFEKFYSTFEFTDSQNDVEVEALTSTVKNKIFTYSQAYGVINKDQIIVKVNLIERNYAVGSISFSQDIEGSGGQWFATKIADQWTLVVETTQEPPSCVIMKKYNFPQSIYGECIEQ